MKIRLIISEEKQIHICHKKSKKDNNLGSILLIIGILLIIL